MAGPLTPQESPARLASLDAYRGFVMLLLLCESLRTCEVSTALPVSALWAFLCHHQSHVPWVGASLHDIIQPSFSFLVGAALPFSLASRALRGQSPGRQILHAAWRALALIALGIWLRSFGRAQTYYTFEDTLTQIGLGYVPLFLLALRPRREQWGALALILIGYWAAFLLYPAPDAGFDFAAVGVPSGWPHHQTGMGAHFDKNSNLAWAFDVWFLNLFPRERPFLFNGGGYATLSFLPTLGTMILGLLAGGVLKSERTPAQRIFWLVRTGFFTLAGGWLLGVTGLCPVVKRIWTPSFTLWSGGVCLLITAAAYFVIDVRGIRRWCFPLLVIGMNSIAAYCLYELFAGAIAANLRLHLGAAAFALFGAAYRPFLLGATSVLVMWLMLYWLYRRRIFLRI